MVKAKDIVRDLRKAWRQKDIHRIKELNGLIFDIIKIGRERTDENECRGNLHDSGDTN